MLLSNTGGNVSYYRQGLLGSWSARPPSLARLLTWTAQTVLCREETVDQPWGSLYNPKWSESMFSLLHLPSHSGSQN